MPNRSLCLVVWWVAGWACCALAAGESAARLIDAGFEGLSLDPAWRSWIYHEGRPPFVGIDEKQRHEGRQALLIAAEAPADVALGQVVFLPPGSLWRARCWVKTENLVARDRTDTLGALHVQTEGGATLARGPSTLGSSPWKETETAFRVPAEGGIKVVLFFVGYGKGTGRAWFDEVRLEAVGGTDRETVRITSERLTRQPIDAKQGGQFIEPLCHLIPSLLAQQVANTSFEEDPAWNVAFKREVDRPHRPWYADGAVHVAAYVYDTNLPFNGQRSLRITLEAAHARAGISQDGFHIEAGRTYRIRLHLRSPEGVSVRASLHGGGGLAAKPVELGKTTDAWRPAQAALRATRTLDNATLTLDFEGPGTVWLDRVSLIGDEAVLGLWRADAVQALRELRPGIIRFGGSALETYEWEQCLGPWDTRGPFSQTYWGGLEENFVGVEEFVQLCQAVDAEPLVCVRWTGKTPADAAAQVEYFNGAADTPMGRRRAQLGRARPYGVKYWQIGNEVGGAAYEASVRAFAEAMRRADATIKVLSSFPSEEILRAAGGALDYLCPHHYGCADLAVMEQDFASLEARIERFGAARPIRIAVTEWNTTAGDWGLKRAGLLTLGNALSAARYHHLMHRHAGSVEMAIRSNLIDSFGSGVIQTGPGWLYLTPTYHAQKLYSRAAGSYPLRMDRRLDEGAPPIPWLLEEPDLSAVLSPDGRLLRLYGVNSGGRALELNVQLAGLRAGGRGGTKHVLRESEASASCEVLNSKDDPDRVRVFSSPCRIKGREFGLEFDPFSITLYELPISQ